jgi:hypothetical protein
MASNIFVFRSSFHDDGAPAHSSVSLTRFTTAFTNFSCRIHQIGTDARDNRGGFELRIIQAWRQIRTEGSSAQADGEGSRGRKAALGKLDGIAILEHLLMKVSLGATDVFHS